MGVRHGNEYCAEKHKIVVFTLYSLWFLQRLLFLQTPKSLVAWHFPFPTQGFVELA